MIRDGLDLHIILSIYKAKKKGEKISSYKIGKSYYWDDKKDFLLKRQESRFYLNKKSAIDYRIRRLSKEKIIDMKLDNGEWNYKLNETILKNFIIHGKKRLCLQLKINDKYVLLEV